MMQPQTPCVTRPLLYRDQGFEKKLAGFHLPFAGMTGAGKACRQTGARLCKDAAMSELSVDPQHPWLGLASFTEDTRAWFYGCDDEVTELARRVQRKVLTILFGQSGLGKTSILAAGIVARLQTEGFCPVVVRIDYSPQARHAEPRERRVRPRKGLTRR
jgi:hypothetical protein